ncbi:J domain-containing protein [Candidatus Poribacteria bacterium]|nr:J domain-containing protein [Candidatus Poribacteria bacterium]
MVKGYLFFDELVFISDQLLSVFNRCTVDLAYQISFKDVQQFRRQLCTWDSNFIKPPMSLIAACHLGRLSDFYRHKLDFSVFQGFDAADQELIRKEIAAYAAREALDALIGYRLRNWASIGLQAPKWQLYQNLVRDYYERTVSQERRTQIKDVEGTLAQRTNLTPAAIHIRCVGELFFEVDEIRLMSKVRLDKYLEGVCRQITGQKDPGGTRHQPLSMPDVLHDSFQFFGLTYPTDLNALRERYHQLALSYHPDKGGSLEMMQQLNTAYRRISDYLRQTGTDRAS